MRSTFSGLEIARTGLNVSQKGLDVTGHNIANVDTAGYTRQRLVNTAYEPFSGSRMFLPVDNALVGSGVKVMILDQIRSEFYDRQFRSEQTLYSEWSTRTTGLTYIESLFEDFEESALTQGINNLFQAFLTLTTEANDKEQRTVVQQAAISLTDSFNQIYDRLMELKENHDTAIDAVISRINTITDNIASLNKSIYTYEMNGFRANDLRDKRNLLIDELSGLVDIKYYETEDNKLVVELTGIPGAELVNHVTANDFNLSYGADGLPESIIVDSTGYTYSSDFLGGELKGHLDLRDNDSNDTPGIIYFIEQLNILARALVQEVNEIHRQGFTHPASGDVSHQNEDFFDESAEVTAGNIRLSDAIINSVFNIAASSKLIDLSGSGDTLQQGNQENARAIYELINKSDLDHIGGFNSFMSGIILDVAITLEHSKIKSENQKSNLLAVDNQRTSVSGVSLDEEMTNLIRYQHAYNGASRVITTMDEALEVLINKMGIVGR